MHLSQAHPPDESDPAWMRYRRREHHPDDALGALVDALCERCRGDVVELCFNGDTFDFDAPWVKDGESSEDEFPLDEPGCAAHMERIVADHPGWFRALARFLLAGHRVTFLSGNHDVELFWPAVRGVVRGAILRAVRLEVERLAENGGDAPHLVARARAIAAEIDARVRFRAWFHVTEDAVYLEHGSQYDYLNAVRHPMLPLTRDRRFIHPVFGKLAFKRTGARMGYMNPYHEEVFYTGLFGYLAHFARYYALSRRRHIVRTFFRGAIRTAAEILRHRCLDERADEGHALACAETGATAEQVRATHALRAAIAEDTMIPIFRQLWLDRAGLAGLVLSATAIARLASGRRAALRTGGALFALFALYELATPKPDLRSFDSAPAAVRSLFRIHGARAIAMGHTHRPFGLWLDEGFHGNSGSWCPAFEDLACTRPVLDGRPFLWLTSEGGALYGGLFFFRDGRIVAEPGATREAPPARAPSRLRLEPRAPHPPSGSPVARPRSRPVGPPRLRADAARATILVATRRVGPRPRPSRRLDRGRRADYESRPLSPLSRSLPWRRRLP